jgi:type IV pilus assembly protein PilA
VFCSQCGNTLAEGAYFCPKCGADNSASATAAPAVGATQGSAFTGPQQTSGTAIGSLVCGLLPFFLITPIVAVVLGHVSLSQIKQSAGRLKGKGLAIAGLVLGYSTIAMLPIILIIAAIAIPNLLRARMVANESAAMAAVRTLNTAEVQYSTLHPEKGFTCSLGDLKEAGLDDVQIADGSKNGYVFELIECKGETPDGANNQYQVIAYPVSPGKTGRRAFCSDQNDEIHYSDSGSGQSCVESGVPLTK